MFRAKACYAHASCLRAACASARAASLGHRAPECNLGVVALCLGVRRAQLSRRQKQAGDDREERLSSKGRTLQKGAAFDDLPGSHDCCFPRASRQDHLVAHLCNVGVRAVQSSRRRVAAAHERGQLLPAASELRGAKRHRVKTPASSQGLGEVGWSRRTMTHKFPLRAGFEGQCREPCYRARPGSVVRSRQEYSREEGPVGV